MVCLRLPWALEKGVYSAVVGWSVLQIFIRSCWPVVLLNSLISLLTFCLVVLSIAEGGVLESPL